jgi:phosphoribosyl 1,2-cyclic phosphodiesterase
MSIKVSVLASGSRGNATFVRTNQVRVLIDCGLGPRTLASRLKSIGESPDRIDAVFVTHEHTDHVAGLPAMLKSFRLQAFMTSGTINRSQADGFERNGSTIVPIVAGGSFVIGDLEVDTVAVPHDAEEPLAFSLRYNGIKVTQLTDLGWIPGPVADLMKGSHILILESNHDLDMLRMGSYPWSLKERLVGRNGHLSNAAVAQYLRGPYDGRAAHIVLAHLSSKNNHPEIARQEACQALYSKGFSETLVSLAAQNTPSAAIELG